MNAKRWQLPAIATVVAVVLAVIYYRYDPSQGGGWFPRCGMYALTGLRCPGCGLQRAAHALLHGDVAAALRFNALLPFIVAALAASIYAEWRHDPSSRLWRAVRHPATTIIIIVVMILWTIVRNFLGI